MTNFRSLSERELKAFREMLNNKEFLMMPLPLEDLVDPRVENVLFLPILLKLLLLLMVLFMSLILVLLNKRYIILVFVLNLFWFLLSPKPLLNNVLVVLVVPDLVNLSVFILKMLSIKN